MVVGRFEADGLDLRAVHRFGNEVRFVSGRERWNPAALFEQIKHGIRLAADAVGAESIRSIGIDGWGVDVALLDAHGSLIEDPVCYRDRRTDGMLEELTRQVSRDEIYRRTGIQFLPINTSVQLFAQQRLGEWPAGVEHVMLLPDYFLYLLTGEIGCEWTNATTTQLVNVGTRDWDEFLLAELGLSRSLFSKPEAPGSRRGRLTPALQRELGLPAVDVIAPGTHDTASAVAGTALVDGFAFLSSGTWSLLGVNRDAPLLSPEAAACNFTNEGGLEGTFRLLKNVTGLWILESCMSVWDHDGVNLSHEQLQRQLAARSPGTAFIDPDDPRFLNPSDMVEEVREAVGESGCGEVCDTVDLAQIVLDSLARRYATVIGEIERVTGQEIRGLHIVGGGSRNSYLNRATAAATGLAVETGPVEATARGNLICQAIAAGRFADLRAAHTWLTRIRS